MTRDQLISAMERFIAKVKLLGPDDCWEWDGAYNGTGRGQFKIETGRSTTAPRAAWELFMGPIPEGQVVRHACDNCRCVNLRHLELGTQSENMHDMYSRGRRVFERRAG